jgi:hypothetical protein
MDNNFCASTANSIGKLVQHLPGIPVDDQGYRFLRIDPALVEIEDLVFPDLGRRRLVLYRGGIVFRFDIREGMSAAPIPDQQRIALGKIPRFIRLRPDLHQPAVTILTLTGRDIPWR